MRLVAQVGAEKPMEGPGRGASDEGREPVDHRRAEGDDPPQRQPDQMGDRQKQAEEHRQAAAPQVPPRFDPDGVVADRKRADRGQRVARGIAVGEQQHVGPELGAIGECVCAQVAQAAGHPPAGQRGEPAEEGGYREQREADLARLRRQVAVRVRPIPGEDGDEEHRRNREDEAEPDAPATLSGG